MIESFVSCLLFGGLAGLLAGMFGIGGGLVLVPFFVWLFTLQGFDQQLLMVIAVATSLATIIFTSISSVIAHHRLGSVKWAIVFRLAPGIIIGAIMGAKVADYFPAEVLRTVFACFLLYVAWQMAVQVNFKSSARAVSSRFYIAAGFIIGLLSAILGIGGGTLSVPLLAKFGLPMRKAVAISSACGLPIAIAGTIGYTVIGWGETDLQQGFWGYVYWPAFLGIVLTSIVTAPIGAKLAYNHPTQKMKRYFSVLLLAAAIKLLW